jgi:hypothetical protein
MVQVAVQLIGGATQLGVGGLLDIAFLLCP